MLNCSGRGGERIIHWTATGILSPGMSGAALYRVRLFERGRSMQQLFPGRKAGHDSTHVKDFPAHVREKLLYLKK